jgi:UDP-N-acetylglucosamine 2-epimerase (non-hydrolysing)/UDP-GlcNAc3NAcA epimerase
LKITTIVGARPQFIKAGPVSRALASAGIAERLVHTGQHYDLNMSDIFFEALGLQEPEHHLGVGSGNHGAQTGAMLQAIEQILVDHRPDALLVYGDTNSTLAGALAAAKLHIPVIHVEAGLRSFNRRMPEEINRVLTDHTSELLFCPTQTAVEHLATEGISSGVHMVGDVMKDALDYWQANGSRQSGVLQTLELGPSTYYLATVHRAENVDNVERLDAILDAFALVELPVVLPLHPRTHHALQCRDKSVPDNVRVVEPVGYLEMLELESNARALLTDSGGVQKEAYMLGVPCITLRDETEWVETVDSGWNVLTGADTQAIVQATKTLRTDRPHPELYGDGRASERIAELTAAYITEGAVAHATV